MRRFVIGVHNGYDVDDYYINAETVDEAITIASFHGTVMTVLGPF